MRPSNIYNESIRQEIKNMIEESGGGSTGREVPAVTSTDDGKVLKATYSEGSGSYDWEDETKELPNHTSSNRGQFLGINSSNDNLGWKEIKQVPTPSMSEDVGEVLQVTGFGTYGWGTVPSGLPDMTNAGDGYVLEVVDNMGTKSATWGTSRILPETTYASEGDVLTINGYGNASWATPSSGGGGESVTTYTPMGWTENTLVSPSTWQVILDFSDFPVTNSTCDMMILRDSNFKTYDFSATYDQMQLYWTITISDDTHTALNNKMEEGTIVAFHHAAS